ncbi:uncharacterized protein B0J16DRAFT_363284 [Fusarium flagelliforme]|uniref:Nad dependent epimerase/dehydratase n=1 Tax=Fusarium flagelliforme TaxID=2675880 RepID=A0A395MWX2_9HYPO|nr:uncharacterized protein B0J16DRAFT_363284 [Fusarium flagelliforme]KAH7182346.1 hypothetical protein B0J16DRAFT_363284 [Fusarium flagelliforme]RFN52428.1 nad dependent epimerase/dehydratase [Fusarium flagelliforme]
MSSENFPLRQSGIYRNLPTFDPSIKGLSAVVCGATGISGYHTIRALLDTPDRWSKVYALSRKPLSGECLNMFSEEQLQRIKHVAIDLLTDGQTVADTLRKHGVVADYVFFYAYLSGDVEDDMSPAAADELIKVNVPLFDNLLDGLRISGLTPRRILLQTGGKNYGMHIGRVRTPLVESDPQPRHLQDNFYYHQEDALKRYCAEHPGTGWNVIRPFGVIGSAASAAITTFHPFAVYASVQAHKGEPLAFGGDWDEYLFESLFSTARLTGYLSEWAVLENKCANQAFNAQDGGPVSWERFFAELARWYGVDKGVVPPVDDKGADGSDNYKTFPLKGGNEAPLGTGPPTQLRFSFTLAEWAKDPLNHQAWKELMDQSGGKVTVDFFEKKKFFSGDFAYLRFGTASPNKCKTFGFNGFVDSLESVFEMYKEMEALGLVMPMKVDTARHLV